MRILVTKITRAAPDGVTVHSYRAGETDWDALARHGVMWIPTSM